MPQQTGKPERPEPIEIDINDTSLVDGELLEYDLKEDFQARSAPPPGRESVDKPRYYKFLLFIDDTKIEAHLKDGYSKGDPNGFYYKKNVICKLQDPTGKWQDSIAYYNFSSAVPRGKKISSMVGMLQLMGFKVPPKLSELAATKLFIKGLQKYEGMKPMMAECDWAIWDSSNTKRNEIGEVMIIAETGKAANTMLNFPKRADGSYQHIVHNKAGMEFSAKLKILKWIQSPAASAGVQPAAPVVQQPAKVVPQAQPLESNALVMGEDGELVLDI